MKYIPFKCIITFLFVIFLAGCEKQDMSETANETADSNIYKNIAMLPSVNTFLVSETTPIPSKDRNNSDFFLPSNPNNVNSLLKYNVRAFRIVYNTKNANNIGVKASGTILIPNLTNLSVTTPLPIVSYQHGTSFKDEDVEAIGFQTELYQLASSGFVVLVPDYLGYKESTQIQHPYFINSCSTRNTRDMISAGLEFISDSTYKITSSGKLFLEGYSEGANVTVALLKSLEESPLADLSVIATSASSGAYNLKNQFNFMTATSLSNNNGKAAIAASLMSYMVYGYEKNIANWNNNSFYFKYPYFLESGIPLYLSGSKSNDEVGLSFLYLFDNFNGIYKTVFAPTFINYSYYNPNIGFMKYLTDNTLTNVNWRPNSQLKLFCGNNDDTVPKINTTQLKDKMDSLPHFYDNVTIETTDTDHSSNPAHMFPYSFVWFNLLK